MSGKLYTEEGGGYRHRFPHSLPLLRTLQKRCLEVRGTVKFPPNSAIKSSVNSVKLRARLRVPVERLLLGKGDNVEITASCDWKTLHWMARSGVTVRGDLLLEHGQ
jgi:hypothetical protein